MTETTAAPAATEQPNDAPSTDRITLEVDRDGWTNGIQLSINRLNEEGVGSGYRLAGPKFNGSGKTLLTRTLDQRDADEIRTCLDAVFPLPEVEVPAVWWLMDDREHADPEVFRTERAAKDEAIQVRYKDVDGDAPELDFAWRDHSDGGIELWADAQATGLIVRQLTVKDAPAAVSTDG
jgi:hypothetical protein